MELYSGAGLENYDGGDLRGIAVDVMQTIGQLREAYSHLMTLFLGLTNMSDIGAVEEFLSDTKRREEFYKLLCAFGHQLNLALNAEQVYNVLEADERQKYQDAFIFFSKVRRSVKILYCDAIDNSEYEPLMQNLLDTHMSVAGLKQLTTPVDILDRKGFEEELEALGSPRSRAEAIANRLVKSIRKRYNENPAFYESFSKRIKGALNEYRDRLITEAEYLERMCSILDDYSARRTTIQYPDAIRNDVNAQAFFGVIAAIFAQDATLDISEDMSAEIAIAVTGIIAKHSKVDWSYSQTIHDRISQDIDDLFYQYEKEQGLKVSFDTVDKLIENVKTVALRRF